MKTIRLSYFSPSVVLAVAQRAGILERHGLDVEGAPVASSPHQFGLIADGACDLSLTSPDNVAAYGLGPTNPLGRRLPVRMVLGLDGGLGLSVMARPGIASLGELRGARIGVDVPQSGFALALFSVLAEAGLRPGKDIEVVTLGATPRRRAGLLAGECDATLLNAGHDLAVEAEGCARLARITDHHPRYLGAVLAATEGWLDEHAQVGRAFAAAWLEAAALVLDPAQDDHVLEAAEPALGLGAEVARAFLAVLRSPADGLLADGSVDRAGLATVLRLRGVDSSSASALVDERLLRAQPV